eukprot:TRINITY_DN3970_c0_g1_i2.p1 TRINITY_DN3970_c0_g1~~TRINITY_DN3970_c0_g1_i2.p1  ORF type:complete len:1857 (+),score=260.12 TRINITY_DN3970_c0_g1_i2:95-5665(+)
MPRRPPLQISVPESSVKRAQAAKFRSQESFEGDSPGPSLDGYSSRASSFVADSAGAAPVAAQIVAVFHKYDLQANGSISASGLAALLTKLAGGVGSPWTPERVAPLMAAAGSHDEGRVKIDDFISWVFSGKECASLAATPQLAPRAAAVALVAGPGVAAASVVASGASSPVPSAVSQAFSEDSPNSPKVARKSRRVAEQRAGKYVTTPGERLYRPRSQPRGVLLLKPNHSFGYVHDEGARFSEGVQGVWRERVVGAVELDPKSYGYCYEESFDPNEILGVRYSVKLTGERSDDANACFCDFPDVLIREFSWLDPSKEERPVPDANNVIDDDCPNSPKVPSRTRRSAEKRACAYVLEIGDRLYRPRSHVAGVLLLQPGGSFSYVHDDTARFFEGVQGVWRQQRDSQVELEPKSFGYCYAESFDANEIIGVCHIITLSEDKCDKGESRLCDLPYPLLTELSWLDPTKEDRQTAAAVDVPAPSADDECPNSPKVPSRSRRSAEKRASAYRTAIGERLFRPRSHQSGVLLLRPDQSFAYVHDEKARFSEGVQGVWCEQADEKVELIPKKFGYCYEESFDEHEIVGVRHAVSLSADACGDSDAHFCDLPQPLLSTLSWLDPTLPEQPNASDAFGQEETDDCPNSPKIPAQKRRKNEKRANAYRLAIGERLYCLRNYRDGRLLLRPDSSFSYVHNGEARFSEGVQGVYDETAGRSVALRPETFGFCYAESFDADEIVGCVYSVAMTDDVADGGELRFCDLPAALVGTFSWLDPTGIETVRAPEEDQDECPNSPKVPERSKRGAEKRAHAHKLSRGEEIYRPRSHPAGVLLLRPNASFSYVHADTARFSEGVQGVWRRHGGKQVELEPTSFGYCYQESFDESEIVGVCHTLTLCEEPCGDTGAKVCELPDALATRFSWLDPSREEEQAAHEQGVNAAFDDECPNSPKVPKRSRSTAEKRVFAYEPCARERLYRPRSHTNGVLLLRPDSTFAYVHDEQARFSEGVQGVWKQQGANKVELDPSSFGYCYEESFDANEILGARHVVTLCEDSYGNGSARYCELSDKLQTTFSWLDPSLEESCAVVSGQGANASDEAEDECPNSPKIPQRERRNAEKRVCAYRVGRGELLYRPRTHPKGVLLLRPDASFSYVHDDSARFSEGVQGIWRKASGACVELEPTSFGYCYEESFDSHEIVGVCYTVTLCEEPSAEGTAKLCDLPAHIVASFSWLDPTKEETAVPMSVEQCVVPGSVEADECPNSPKVPQRSRRHVEKRAGAHCLARGEKLYRPRSHPAGVLLLRPDLCFSYVHNETARFSEGVQGVWRQKGGSNVELEPQSFGYCYEESFDAEEIIGVCHIVTLAEDQFGESDARYCDLSGALLTSLSWLDPSLPEKPDVVHEEAEECPNSPKVPERSKRGAEKRAHAHKLSRGEEIYRPRSHPAGVLLLRPNESFSYVHDDTARFSEGVQGVWRRHGGKQVELEPTSFGYCYQESFDESEIVGVCHTLTLCEEPCGDTGAKVCELPEPLLTKFSWLDPTRDEENEPSAGNCEDDVEEECPNSPKIPQRSRRSAEKRACSYRPDGAEKLYRPRSHTSGMLLLAPDATFSYVHDGNARFSEGVQGKWRIVSGNRVELRPTGFGYCYEESFDAEEIVGVCHTVFVSEERCEPGGVATFCDLHPDLLTQFSWLNPTLAESGDQPAPDADEECPNSPKVPQRSRRRGGSSSSSAEKRANVYEPAPRERLFRPRSYEAGLLLLRPDASFAYVHEGAARFSEGVFGTWRSTTNVASAGGVPDEGSVELKPEGFGYSYQESFDAEEIVGVCHSVALSKEPTGLDTSGSRQGSSYCDLPRELQKQFSWLNPTLAEVAQP